MRTMNVHLLLEQHTSNEFTPRIPRSVRSGRLTALDIPFNSISTCLVHVNFTLTDTHATPTPSKNEAILHL